MTKEYIKNDILAFADDDSDVLFESDGVIIFYKNGRLQTCRIITNQEGNLVVEYEGEQFSYKTFIARKLANLEIFARKIHEKRKPVYGFVDTPAILKSGHKETGKTALILLQEECNNFLEFGSKITFITADAGHGKSALLRQYQYLQADLYLKNQSNYLFWHIDLQGRDLVRLPEAIMYDLGELRLPGLYYSSIINLIQKRLIILAIDGFDELAAEIGGMNAVSSLANFINEMQGQGTLIAASRRTFFDTHDYLKRTSILKSNVTHEIIFNELKLKNWTKKEVIEYFNNCEFNDSEEIYNRVVAELHDEKHPILTRPFLLTKLTTAIKGDKDLIPSFFSKSSPDQGVSQIVESFTRREVDKWKERDSKTGKPYLSFDQHIKFLSEIANAMWEAKRDYVTVEEIEYYAALLLTDWKIDETIKPIVMNIVKTHAFLIPVNESKFDARKFDHEEFKNYFLARSLAELIETALMQSNYYRLKRFLYIDQLPDSVGMYCFNYVKYSPSDIHKIIQIFKHLIEEEYKPTYLQMNIGTLFPFMIDKIAFEESITFDSKVTYTSLVFENKNLKNITFENGTFINISLRDTCLENVHFRNCSFNEIKVETQSKNCFENVLLKDCQVNSIVLLDDGDVKEVAYSPKRIKELLIQSRIDVQEKHPEPEGTLKDLPKEKSEFKKTLNRFLLKFNKMTIQYEKSILEEKHFGNNSRMVVDEIIPLAHKYGIIETIENKYTRQAQLKAWRLVVPIEELFKYDGVVENNRLSKFWDEVNSK
jgi:hypothetical protein